MASGNRNRSEHHERAREGIGVWKPHKDWRVWVALILMLVAIFTYVFTLDNSIIPR